jgi:hypothetical protein
MLSYHKQVVIPVAESWPAILGAPPAALDPIVPGHEFVLFGDGPAASVRSSASRSPTRAAPACSPRAARAFWSI